MPVNGDFIIFEVASDTFEFSRNDGEGRFESLQARPPCAPAPAGFGRRAEAAELSAIAVPKDILTQEPGFFRTA